MLKQLSLCALRDGESAYVNRVEAEPALRRRLLDLGLVPGTRVTCQGRSPAGDPTAYLIRGAVIALRSSDAHTVTLERAQEPLEAGAVLWA